MLRNVRRELSQDALEASVFTKGYESEARAFSSRGTVASGADATIKERG